MPRYYFGVITDTRLMTSEGEELADDLAARELAIVTARELARNNDKTAVASWS